MSTITKLSSLSAAAIVPCLLAAATATADISIIQAIQIAKAEVPEATVIEAKFDADDNDGPMFDVELVRQNASIQVEVKIDPVTGEVLEVETESNDDAAEDRAILALLPSAKISFSQAYAIARSRFEAAPVEKIELEIEHGRLVYKVLSGVGDRDGRIDVDAITGRIVRGPANGASITFSQAMIVARQCEDNEVVLEIELEIVGGRTVYTVELALNNAYTESEIDMEKRGAALLQRDRSTYSSNERNYNRQIIQLLPTANLSFFDAMNIARNELPGASVRKLELIVRGGRLFYKVRLREGAGDHSIVVDAINGQTSS